jgi:hypothetical protein
MIDVRSRITPRKTRQDFLFGVGIHRRQRIVQNQDAGIDQHRARDGGSLFLAAGQRDPALADHRVVALREIGDVFVEARDFRGGDDRAYRLSPPDLLAHPTQLPRWRRTRTRCCPASVSENRNGSCGTNPIALRRTPSGRSRTSTPSMNTVPGGGSCRRASSEISVDFPSR